METFWAQVHLQVHCLGKLEILGGLTDGALVDVSTGRQEIKVNIYLRISQMHIEKINKLDILELLLSPPNISSLSNLLILKDENNERPIFFL